MPIHLSSFNLQIAGLLILCYFGAKLISSEKIQPVIDATVLTSLVTLLVASSGGLHSSLFFLLYFLLFGLSLLFATTQIFILSLVLIILFYLESSTIKIDQTAIINLITLLFITPLASIFGKKYLQNLEAQGKIKILDKIIREEETDTLIWISTQAKPTLINLLDITSQIIGSNLLSRSLQEKLIDLHQNLISLHESANTLEKDIDQHNND